MHGRVLRASISPTYCMACFCFQEAQPTIAELADRAK
jgi:hypothetical protein